MRAPGSKAEAAEGTDGADAATRSGDGQDLRIGLVDPDPYLELSLRREFPDATFVRCFDDPAPIRVIGTCDLLIVELRGPNAKAAMEMIRTTPVIGVGRIDLDGSVNADQVDVLLLRPFLADDLSQAVRSALGLPETDVVRDEPRGMPVRIQGWMGPARVGAIALAAVLNTAVPRMPSLRDSAILAAAFVYATVRLGVLRRTTTGVWLDVAVAVALIGTTGGHLSNYLVFGLVVAFAAGLILNTRDSLMAGGFISAAAIPALLAAFLYGPGARPLDVFFVLAVFPLATLAGGQAARLAREREIDPAVEKLREANRALRSLYEVARELPGSLTLQSVAEAVLEELVETLDVQASTLLVTEAGVVYEVAAKGLTEHARLLVEREELPRGLLPRDYAQDVVSDVPETFLEHAPDGLAWASVALSLGTTGEGWILIGRDAPLESGERRILDGVVRGAVLAIENARLFARVRDMAVDEERHRLATDLHDGVAQALAHVRLELELLARSGMEDRARVVEDADRLVQVIQRALADVRSTIADLRAASLAGGLAVAIHDHCRDIQLLTGPRLKVRTRSAVRLEAATETELFRIFRAAVSNAVRHAGTEHVEVLLETVGEELHLVVEDDGRNIPERYDRRLGRENAGLRSMRERAERIDARLDVTQVPDGGTRVTVVYAMDDTEEPATAGMRT